MTTDGTSNGSDCVRLDDGDGARVQEGLIRRMAASLGHKLAFVRRLRVFVVPLIASAAVLTVLGTVSAIHGYTLWQREILDQKARIFGHDWTLLAALPHVRPAVVTTILLALSLAMAVLVGWLLIKNRRLTRNQHEFDLVLNNTSLRMVFKDDKNNLVRCNKVAADIFGLTPAEAVGRSMYELNPIPAKKHHMQDLEVIRAGLPSLGEVKQVWIADGVTKWNRVDKIPYKDLLTGEDRILVVGTDVSDQVEIEQKLRLSEERYNLAIEMSSIGTWDWNIQSNDLYWSPRMREIVGIVDEAFEPINSEFFTGLLHPDDIERVGSARREHLENRTPYHVEFRLRHKQGSYVWVRARGQAVWDDAGKPVRMAGSTEDITERVTLQNRLTHLAHHDVLTGLLNRVLFQERMAEASERAQLGEPFALLSIDLDGFKTVNDTLGHLAGDKLLKLVAQRLGSCVRNTDTLARLGGDEFAMIHSSMDPLSTSRALAARVIGALSAPYYIDGTQTQVGVSIGVAIARGDGADSDRLMKEADLALYRAKHEGRGVFRFFEPAMSANIEDRQALAIDLRNALANDEFALHYQPLVSVATNEIVGFEALARWNHPKRGWVPPVEFISVAEESGLINKIGEWVLMEACREAATWPDGLKVAVNVSPIQFRGGIIMLVVAQALARSGLRADRLELEITETVLLEENEGSLGVLRQLHELGVLISLDDFGTGYSSLSYLQHFPFDKIKIDSSFIARIGDNDDDIGIVHAVVSLAAKLGVETTAEGVETEEQLAVIREEGCTEMQGYLFSPPRPAEEIARLFLGRPRLVPRTARSA
jgi:diguanylate cyclase (GGDEF)-like protein/PAS domain S-box-containing protein